MKKVCHPQYGSHPVTQISSGSRRKTLANGTCWWFRPGVAGRPPEGLQVISIESRVYKHPGGWETALAVKDVFKKNSSGAVALYTFYDEHYLKLCRSKLNDFEGMSWYLQGFGVVAGWNPFPFFSVACHLCKVCSELWLWDYRSQWNFHGAIAIARPLLIPWSNWGLTTPSLRVASTYVRKVHGRYHPTPPHPTHDQWRSNSVASTYVRKVHGRYHPTPPHPTHDRWRSNSVASTYVRKVQYMDVTNPPHPTQPMTGDVATA